MAENVSIESFFDAALVQSLLPFSLAARRAMLGSISGRHRSPHRGASVEFAEYRRYQPGDDLRRLDWRAYGRSDRYYVKEFEADTDLRLVLVLDCSGSMAFGKKMAAGRRIVATLAALATGQGDAAGLLCCGELPNQPDLRWLAPRRVSGHLSLLLERLAAVDAEGTTTLTQELHELSQQIRQRAWVVVISDLLLEPDELRSAMEHLAFRQHDLAVFHLLDPRELEPDWDRPVRIDDIESGESMVVDPVEIAAGYRDAVLEYRNEIESMMRQGSVDYHSVVLDDSENNRSVDDALRQFSSQRNASSSNDPQP